MKSLNFKKSMMLFGIAGMLAGSVACNSPQNQGNDTPEVDPMEENNFDEPAPTDDTTSAVDTTLTDTLEDGF